MAVQTLLLPFGFYGQAGVDQVIQTPTWSKDAGLTQAKVIFDFSQHTDPTELVEVFIDVAAPGSGAWREAGGGRFPGATGYGSVPGKPPSFSAGLPPEAADIRARCRLIGRIRFSATGEVSAGDGS